MQKHFIAQWALGTALLCSLMSCSQKDISTGNLNVIPLPQEVTEYTQDSPFVIDSSTKICYPADNEKLQRTAHFLASYIKEITGTEVGLTTQNGENCIILSVDSTIPHQDGYELLINSSQIQVKGTSEAGVFYGIQTIHKALPVTQGKSLASLPAGMIKDYPNLLYRGFMVDVGRHFFSVDYLKEIIDMLALHNINYFHWHLTEDQGWRIEIKKYPKLTEVGSVRKETIVARNSDQYDGTPVKGFYTQEQAREIVAYAAERFITVIPEIDMPGHMLAALASYPELGCTGGPYEVATRFGVFDKVLCGGNEKTLQFAKDVINEIMDIFPGPYIHIGGDECPKKEWKKCPKCQAKIKELGLKDSPERTKENQLQSYFMAEVEKEITARGRKVLAWDEVLEGHPTASTTVMAWTGVKAGIRSAREGHQTIVCPISHLYFSNPGYNQLKGVESIGRVYNFNPLFEELNTEEKERIIGVQACIWTEWTKDSTKMEWQMMPRIAALSELQWSNPDKKNFDFFLSRLPHMLELYTAKGYHYKTDIYDVTLEASSAQENGKSTVSLATFDKVPVYYTTDGTEPDSTATLYTSPFTLTDSTTVVKAKAMRKGELSETFSFDEEIKAAFRR